MVPGGLGADTFDVLEIHEAWRANQPDLETLRGKEEAVVADLRRRRSWGVRWLPVIMPWVWSTAVVGAMSWDLWAGVGLLVGLAIATRGLEAWFWGLGLPVLLVVLDPSASSHGLVSVWAGTVAGVTLKVLYRLGLMVYVSRLWKRAGSWG